jgi:HK97 family phage prohead protease
MNGDRFATPVELKFTETSSETGEFEGYGAVYGNQDAHGDTIESKAFAASLAEHEAKGTMPAMYVEHSAFLGGDKLPSGVWTSVKEDDHGLYCKGRILALDTDHGRRILSLMKGGVLKGLSIAFRTMPNGVVYGKNRTRTLKNLALKAIDLVISPANELARIEAVKSEGGLIDPERAAIAIAEHMTLFEEVLAGGNSPSAEQRATMRRLQQDAHEAVTGRRNPPGLKSKPETEREFESLLRESCGFSHSEARAIAVHGFKSSSTSRDEGKATATATEDELREAHDQITALLKRLS